MSLKKYGEVSQRAATFDEVKVQGKQFQWPHETPSPNDMAKLGFYYNPSKSMNDRIKCFWCKRSNGSWKNARDLVRHHLDKNHDCLLSNLVQLTDILSNDLEFHYSATDLMLQNPLSDEALKLREKSFGDDWYVDEETDAIPTSKNLAAAGFYRMDDAAYCIHCHVSLEGWSNDDDPIAEHKQRVDKKKMKCYFLDQLEQFGNQRKSLKRYSSAIEEIEEEKIKTEKVKESLSDHNESEDKHTSKFSSQISEIASSLPSSRILRKKHKASYIESDGEQDNNESFGITANDEEFNGFSYENNDEDQDEDIPLSDESFEIEQPKKSKSKSKSKSKKKEKIKPTSKEKSKSKPASSKSKILDSSFDDNDIFAAKKNNELNPILDTVLRSLSPERKSTSTSPHKDQINPQTATTSKNNSKAALNDITNTISKNSSSMKKSIEAPSLDPESEDDEPILLVSNNTTSSNKSNTSIYHHSKDNKDDEHDDQEEEENASSKTIKPPKSQDSKSTLIGSNAEGAQADAEAGEQMKSNHVEEGEGNKEMDEQPDSMDEEEDEIVKPSPKKTNQLKKICSSSSPLSNGTTTHTEVKSGGKSILESISRLIKSPELERSRSPFLDSSYKGSDKVEDLGIVIGPDDIPLEESTDHHIVLNNATEKSVTSANQHTKQLEKIQDQNTENDEEAETSSTSSQYHSAENESRDRGVKDQDDNSENNDSDQDAWAPMDTNDLFEHLEPIETAKNYLGELKDLGYELNDDTDGRVSYFINEMPENEINMTVSEWIKHSALQGSQHVKELGQKLIESYEMECEKVKEKIRNLPTY